MEIAYRYLPHFIAGNALVNFSHRNFLLQSGLAHPKKRQECLMNPLASSKCARRLLMALTAISGIFLTAGCGSGGPILSLGGGFSKASLKGQYVIAQTGVGINQLL